MAKFAKCGYGSKGQGLGATTDGYTYIVNDNVRTGDVIQVISTSSRGKKFATTAVPLHTFKETTAKGQMAKQEVEQKGKDITQSYTGKEVGLTRKGTGRSEYTQQVRAENIGKYKEQNPSAEFTQKSQETFDSYSKQFIGKGEQ